MSDLRRSLLITFFSSTGTTALHFALSLVLARLLSPHDIGVFSMTVVFVNIAHMFRDFGVATYVQRERDLTVDKMRSAMGVMYLTSWSIASLLYLAAGALARWFGEPAMEQVMRVLALGFVAIPFASLTQSLLVRELAADKQAWITAAGTLSYCSSALCLAWLGFGAASLAWANLLNILATVLVCLRFRPAGLPWLPSLREWRAVVRFSAGSLATNCANAVNNALPDVLLGKLGSASQVGLFSRANSTVSIFSHVAGATINYGAVAWMSRSHHEGQALAPVLLRAARLLTGIGWPAFAVTALVGHDLVRTLYGEAWLDAVAAMAPLALAAAATLSFHYLPATLTALGRPYLSSQPLLAMIAVRIALAAWLFDGTLASFGWAICLATLATTPLMVWMQGRYVGLKAGAFLRALGPSALVTLACAAGAWLCQALLPAVWPAWLRLLAMAPVLLLLWYGALRVSGHALVEEIHRLGARMRNGLAGSFGRAEP